MPHAASALTSPAAPASPPRRTGWTPWPVRTPTSGCTSSWTGPAAPAGRAGGRLGWLQRQPSREGACRHERPAASRVRSRRRPGRGQRRAWLSPPGMNLAHWQPPPVHRHAMPLWVARLGGARARWPPSPARAARPHSPRPPLANQCAAHPPVPPPPFSQHGVHHQGPAEAVDACAGTRLPGARLRAAPYDEGAARGTPPAAAASGACRQMPGLRSVPVACDARTAG